MTNLPYNRRDFLKAGSGMLFAGVASQTATADSPAVVLPEDSSSLFSGGWLREHDFADSSFDQGDVETHVSEFDLENADVSNVKYMGGIFQNANSFNQDISNWDTSNVQDMRRMFTGTLFNQDISNWDTSNVQDMSQMFRSARSFNQDIGNWDTSNVQDMSRMFRSANSFNQDIGGWDTSNVQDMSQMFRSANSFNQDIGNWDTSNVQDMSRMFNKANSFNQDIGGWDTSNVQDMTRMFWLAESFDQDISTWSVEQISDKPNNFDSGAGFSSNHDKQPNWGGENISDSRLADDSPEEEPDPDNDSLLPETAAGITVVSVLSIAGYTLFRQRDETPPKISESEAQTLAGQARSAHSEQSSEQVFADFQEAIDAYQTLAETASDEDEQTVFQITADELRDELCALPDEISDQAHNAKEERNYQTALDQYDRAIELCEMIVEWLPADDSRGDSLQEQLPDYRNEREAIETILADREELQELVTTAEDQLQSAITSHICGEKVAARTRYRQARTNFERALTHIDDTDDELLDPPIEIEVAPDDQTMPDQLTTVTEFSSETRETLEEEGIETVAKLQERASDGQVINTIIERDVSDDQQLLVELLGHWEGEHTRILDGKQLLQDRHSIAEEGYQTVV
ncbi:BspA family leucine-rich repeat surface protein [Salinadaptatus halalkaliphilus]|uniref:BspA family leucine-rich repeat surface protein n=1 Tax=Salinadaptatus halalkaliphilus TaxID=2419781 RepID=A0A4S3TLY1_9EURY|nr:BspA family leucine-rich repeat surface protein [Salinadaptatus halalkaliphilus]THE64610.1 BspA family leucine-rich repeat surface protein [Salinadaptatus halalkaliphilus]